MYFNLLHHTHKENFIAKINACKIYLQLSLITTLLHWVISYPPISIRHTIWS